MELETGTLETVSEEPVRESLPGETEPETAGSEQTEAASETQTESETVTETSETESPEETETEAETETHELPVSVSGNTVIFPEGYGYITAGYSAGDPGSVVEALDAQTKAVEAQTEAMREGFIAICFLLGAILGILLVQGFRLRRV